MAAGYIPRNDTEFLAWMNNFFSEAVWAAVALLYRVDTPVYP